MLKVQLLNIIIWAAIWIASWGIFFAFIYKRIDYIKHFVWTALYFLGTAVFTLLIFKNYLLRIVQNFSVVPLVILVLLVILHVVLYIYLPRYLKEPKEYFQRFPKRTYLTLNIRRLFSKSADLLSQQVFVVLLVLFLQDAGLNLEQIIFAFAVIFGIVHAPLIIFEKSWLAWYFITASVLSAIIFPILITKVQYGFVYSYIGHWIFYTSTAVGFWLIYAKRKTT